MIYYRITDGELRNISDEIFASMAQVKRDIHRPYEVDPRPTPSATQHVVDGPVNVTPTEARKTWLLVDKTAAELQAEADATEQRNDYTQAKAVIAAMKAGTGTAAERLARLEKVVARLAIDRIKELGA